MYEGRFWIYKLQIIQSKLFKAGSNKHVLKGAKRNLGKDLLYCITVFLAFFFSGFCLEINLEISAGAELLCFFNPGRLGKMEKAKAC